MSQALNNSTPTRHWPSLALVRKELRGAAGIIVLAVIANGLFVLGKTGARDVPGLTWLKNVVVSGATFQPFLSGEFYSDFAKLSALFAAALGFWQTLGESLGHSGTWPFLLHRPVSRRCLVLTKLAVGLGLVLGLSAATILVYAAWGKWFAITPIPFEWSMTHRAWHLWLWPPLVYCGAFLSGLRPARWWGTRLWPGVVSLVPWFFSHQMPYWIWWPGEASLAVLLDAWFVVVILDVMAERDFG
jgi:hypothetical protein